jgi:hypothetical protein
MKIEEMIETLRYKAMNIKAKIEPDFFYEVADRLEKYKKENEALKCRCKSLGQGVLCEFCPIECKYRTDIFYVRKEGEADE